MDDLEHARTGPGTRPEHLVWHQDLICPDERCRGRVRRFPPGELIDGGASERRRCPACGTEQVTPAFYLVAGRRAHRRARADPRGALGVRSRTLP